MSFFIEPQQLRDKQIDYIKSTIEQIAVNDTLEIQQCVQVVNKVIIIFHIPKQRNIPVVFYFPLFFISFFSLGLPGNKNKSY
jgi:hypothetical protein